MKQITQIVDLIYLAKQQGVEIILNDAKLQLKVNEGISIDQDLLEEIKKNKPQIINFLSNENWKSKSVGKNHNKLEKFNRGDNHIPLSFSQERLWFIDQLQGSLPYHIPIVLRLNGTLNTKVLSQAFKTLIDRHEVLRTVFLQQEGKAYQSIKDTKDWQFTLINDSIYKQSQERLKNYINQIISAPFDLEKNFMIRATLIALNEDEHVLVIAIHHIASDGWSVSVLLSEITELYNAFVDERLAQLPPLPIQYADYSIWEHKYLKGDVLDKKIAYWKNKLEDIVPLQLTTDYVRPLVKGTNGSSIEFNISKELTDQIQIICQKQGTTLFMTLLTAYKILLYRYSSQEDICVGTSIANRDQPEVEKLIGFFVNTLALRSKVNSKETFTELLQQVRTTTMEAYENKDLSFEKVVENVVKERDNSRSPLFQVMLVLHNTPVVQLRLGEVEVSVEKSTYENAKFDITFFINETVSGLKGRVEYSTDLFKDSTINRMIGHFNNLLSSIVKNPNHKIHELNILTSKEEDQLLNEFNNSKVNYPKDKSIVDLFEESILNAPNATAVVFENEQLTYKQLNEKANQLAHYLKSKGVKDDVLVPLFIDRGIDMIIGIMAILKAGGAYVPLDLDFPEERINYMLKDIDAHIVITNKKSKIKLPTSAGLEIIEIDNNETLINNQPNQNLQIKVQPHHLAYVIYTSGSTGMPKGVMIEHRSLVDYLFGLKQQIQIDECNSFALVSSIATDLGNTVIYSSLIFGGELHLFSKDAVSNKENLQHYFNEHKIDCLKIVPSHWKVLSDDDHLLLPVKLLVFGGEALQVEVIEKIRLSVFEGKVVNHYGPTETTIGKLLHSIVKNNSYEISIPLGKPFSNTRVYILNKDLSLCPLGIPGQLFIEGDGLARGYLNNSELTKEKFIQNPFNSKKILYSTGDQVKYMADGNIHFLGRVDNQIKMRGYRVELGEIENVLLQCPDIIQAVVLVKEDTSDNKQLIGYVVADRFDKEAYISYLKSRLPDYMIPAVWIPLESMPLTVNGKIDRKALPNFDIEGLLNDKYVAPAGRVENKLVEIWQNVLELDKIGVNDDFFEIGGHSLLAVRLISAIRKEFSVEIPISYIFDHPNIASLTEWLQNNSGADILPSVKAVTSRPQRIPLSFSQERLWFIDELEGSVQYHVPSVWRLRGELNKKALSKALQEIINRHEVLRTVILADEGKPYQHILGKDIWKLSLKDGLKLEEDFEGLKHYIKQIIINPFDLSKDHMIRANLIVLNPNDHILIITLHHIASDGWSTSILVKELIQLYAANVENRDLQLAPLEIQYADYAIWQRNYLQGNVLDKKINYWKKKLDGVSALQMPTDHQRPAVWSTRGTSKKFSIDKVLSAQLQALSQQQGATLYMTLLSAFKILLHRHSGQKDICIGSPIAGRQQHNLENLIGFFVNTLALRSEVNSDSSFINLLQNIKITMLEAYENQDAPFEKVVDAVVKERDLSRNPIFQVMFVLRNTPEVPEINLGKVLLTKEGYENTTALFDITLFLTETHDGLQGNMEYATDLFEEKTIVRILDHFKILLDSIVKNPQQKIGELSLLTPDEKKQLLVDFNNTKVDYPKDKSLVNLFEEQVAKTPEAIAIVFEKEQITYNELNKKANQLAHYLISKGVKEEAIIPICIERGIDMIIGIIGILKTGAAYVPIDPDYPQERINYMLNDTSGNIVVSSKQSRLKLFDTLDIIELDSDNLKISDHSFTNIQTTVTSKKLAYVIYTSGSTGKPKGVMIEHRSVVNFLMSMIYDVEFTSESSILSVTTFSFDICYLEFFLPLLCGGKLFIVSREVAMDGFKLSENISHYSPTHMQATPTTWQLLLECEWENKESINILIGGEAVKDTLKDKLTKLGRVFNLYGPTETTIWSAIKKLDINNIVTIGKPIANTSIYILNEQQQLCPVKVSGEIYIGGDGLSRGYFNRPDLTAEKFIQNPYSTATGEKIYKTGDIGKWLPDGEIECLGRKDNQVKIRGYRIELGEIETAIVKSELVNQAAVVIREDNEDSKSLVGYYIPKWEVVKAKESELYNRQVTSWQEIYESEYANTEPGLDEEFDINIWKDSFTGRPIPPEQMQEWLTDIVDIILTENTENVLEIGSGTGLIFYQLAGKIKKYIGTDFSPSSINQISERIKKGKRNYGITKLKVCAAHEVSLDEDDLVDTIVLNSIIQYFPGETYMNDVIHKCISLLKGQGRIIIGDVRDNRLLGLFKGRLGLQKMPNSSVVQEFNWVVDQDLLKEEELCFSPDYFFNLKSVYPEITHVEIKWKQGSYINELTLYRFNVVIYIGGNLEKLNQTWQNWSDISDKQIIFNQIKEGINTIALKDVPNYRLWQEELLNRTLKEKSADTVGDIVNIINKQETYTIQVKEILDFAQAKGYSSNFLLDEDPFFMNIVLEINSSNKLIEQPYSDKGINNLTQLTNTPLFNDINLLLQKDIRSYLQKSLPEYMIPSELIALNKMPLTNNDKVDRNFLHERKDRALVNKLNYEAPRTKLELDLINIWQNLLNIPTVGIHDNFFELGGHSLMAMRVISFIRKELNIELSIKALFQYTTINDLSKYIELQTNSFQEEKTSTEYDLLNI